MKQYTVDAFTEKVFAGNPAAVCIMDAWQDEETMEKIAIENNLSETAFAVKEGERYRLRWFTPGGEVELCGHATLATAYVITSFFEPDAEQVEFDTLSGILTVKKEEDLLVMDLPSFQLKPVEIDETILKAIGLQPQEAYMGADLVCVLDDEEEVRSVIPDLEAIRKLEGVCLHVTARGKKYDCVTRTFAPKCNVPEDPVCGRGHCHVVPFWAKKLERDRLTAYQASKRGGVLFCEYRGDRTVLKGKAALFAESEIYF